MAGWRSGYFKVSGIAAPRSSKACRWALVGSASIGTVNSVPANRTWSRVRVARCSSRLRKLRQGCPAGPCWYVPWPGRPRSGGRGRPGFPGGRLLVGEGQWCPGAARVPGDVAGEHADQYVGLDAFLEPVEGGLQVQVVGFDVPEVPLRPGISRQLRLSDEISYPRRMPGRVRHHCDGRARWSLSSGPGACAAGRASLGWSPGRLPGSTR